MTRPEFRTTSAKATPELKKEALRRFRNGENCHQIAVRLSLSYTTVRCWTDPEYLERKNQRRKQREAEKRVLTDGKMRGNQWTTYFKAKADGERLAKVIPPDTRDLSARLCGDPLPGRSALDKIKAKQNPKRLW